MGDPLRAFPDDSVRSSIPASALAGTRAIVQLLVHLPDDALQNGDHIGPVAEASGAALPDRFLVLLKFLYERAVAGMAHDGDIAVPIVDGHALVFLHMPAVAAVQLGQVVKNAQ